MGAALSLQNVSYSRRRRGGTVNILDHLNIEISAGQSVGIMGRSGVGKSTLINLIAGYLHPRSGVIYASGERVVAPSASRIVVFQAGSLWPWLSLEENVALGLGRHGRESARQRMVNVILERFGITEAREAYPGELSGGMQKRAELARAILARPQILMLDEAFGSVDPVTKEICIQTIQDYRKNSNATILTVSHDIEEITRISSQIVMLAGQPARIAQTLEVPSGNAAEREGVRAEILRAFGHRL